MSYQCIILSNSDQKQLNLQSITDVYDKTRQQYGEHMGVKEKCCRLSTIRTSFLEHRRREVNTVWCFFGNKMPVNIEDRPIVMVTGFGPFLGHPVNASWEAVKLMNKDAIEKKHNIEFVSLELPVTYSNVDEFVPALWETHTPKLMIHVGVSSIAKDITLEMQARRKGYSRVDYLNNCPVNNVCTATGAVRLKTKLNVEAMCDKFNEGAPEKTHAVASRDAGIYLCEYIYYTSLSVDNERTLFVHVPDMSVYSSERTAKALERIVDLCLEQINQSEKTDEVAEKLADSNINDEDDELDLEP